MKVAVVFDTLHPEWEDADYKREVEAQVDEAEYEVAEALMEKGHDVRMIGIKDDIRPLVEKLAEFGPELVFNCCEGFRGDSHYEYAVAAVLEAYGYRHTGSPATALLVARNKSMSKKILAFHGIRVPDFATFHRGDEFLRPSALRYPLIVKPLLEDASIGISQASVVSDHSGLAERVAFVHEQFNQPAIAEEFVDGRELYVSILGNGERLEILPLVEMVWDKHTTKPEERIATRLAKWDTDYRARKGIRNVFARPVSQRARQQITAICSTAYRALWLRDYARLDVRLTRDGDVWVIEANANPFISYGHDMANAAEKAGLRYEAFVNRIVDEAIRRYEQQP